MDYKKKRCNRILRLSIMVIFFTSFISMAQTSNIVGCWKNEFNSVIKITDYNISTSEIKGLYSSTTGSSGTYDVTGMAKNTESGDVAITLMISWNSVREPATDDASKYWTSTMSGIYKHDQGTLNLLNVIAAPGAFPELGMLPGTYPQSLIFTKVLNVYCREVNQKPLKDSPLSSATSIDPAELLTGWWNNVERTYFGDYDLDRYDFNFISVTLNPSGKYYDVYGYVNLPVAGNMFSGICALATSDQRVSISVAVDFTIEGIIYNIAFAGFLEKDADNRNVLKLFTTKSSVATSNLLSNSLSYGIYVKK